MAPMFPFGPQAQINMPISSHGNVAWPHMPMHIHSQPAMTAFSALESAVLNEKPDNYLPPTSFTPVNLQKENITNKPVTTKTEDITFVSENNHVNMNDQMDIDYNSDAEHAEHADPTIPTQKRKRMTNNSLNHDLDAGVSDLDIRPPFKRMHCDPFEREHTFSPGYAYPDGNLTDTELSFPSTGVKFTPLDREKGVLIGMWRESPCQDLSKRHAVWGFLDAGGSIRRKIMPETRDGERIEEGNPIGTGRSFVSSDSIIPEPHISNLTTPELKEYIRIRAETKSQNELPEERRKAEAAAVLEAKMAAADSLPAASPTPIATPTPTATATTRGLPPTLVDVSALNTDKTRPKGFLVGFWKFSDALEDADKHAIYSVVDGSLDGPIDSVRLRVKIAQRTRDQRPYRGNFPATPGGTWVPYEHIILDPALASLNRLELTEYVRIRHRETAEGKSVLGNWIIDFDAIERAKASLAAEAKASGYDPDERNREAEIKRTSQYKLKMANREKEHRVQRLSNQSPKAMAPTAHMHTPSSGVKGSSRVVFRGNADSERAETIEVRPATSTSPANRKGDEETAEGPTISGREVKVERPVEKPMAKRSNKAEALARMEKMLRKQKKDIVRENGHLKEQAQKSGIASRRIHNLNEPFGMRPGGLPNDKHRSEERAARIYDEPERKSKELMRQDMPRERAEARETMSGEGKMIEKKRLEKDPRAQATERVDSEARANMMRTTDDRVNSEEPRKFEENRKSAEIIRSEERKKAAEMKKVEEEKAEDQREQVEQELRAEGQRRKLEEQRKVEEQKRTEERSLAEERQDAQAKEKELERQERHHDKTERDIPLASPARATPPQGNWIQFEAPAPTPGVKRHNDVMYERRNGGAFAGKLVGNKRELITIDGEDYVEYRILMRTEF